MMTIMTVGGATQDIFIQYNDAQIVQWHSKENMNSCIMLQEGTKMEVDTIHYATGGGATNTAVSFKRLGFSAIPFFKIGKDEAGKRICATLEIENISTHFCHATVQEATGISFIIPAESGDRTVLAFRGANTCITQQEFPFEQLAHCDGIYITSLSGTSAYTLLPITRYAHNHQILVVHNPGANQLAHDAPLLKDALQYIDILILNFEEAQQLMHAFIHTYHHNIHITSAFGHTTIPPLLQHIESSQEYFNLVHFFQEIHMQGPRIVVVTNGKDGVYVYHNNNIYFHPSIPTKIASTLGAGDAFGSCFVATYLQTKSIEQAIVAGVLNSSSVISYMDAKQGLLRYDTLQQLLTHVSLSGIQKYIVR